MPFSQSLALVRGLLERYWESVHPKLDGMDSTMRVNVISALNDPGTFLNRIRSAPLSNSPVFGRLSYRDVLVAKGELPPLTDSQNAPPEASTIAAALADTPEEEMELISKAVGDSLDHVHAIEACLAERLGSDAAPDLGRLSDLLSRIQQTLAAHPSRPGPGEPAAAESETRGQETADQSTAEPPRPAGQGGEKAAPQGIGGPEDVVAALDRICAYYDRHEPSSPVPMLLRRAKRLVSKSFMEIILDLAPESAKHIEKIRGDDNEKFSE